MKYKSLILLLLALIMLPLVSQGQQVIPLTQDYFSGGKNLSTGELANILRDAEAMRSRVIIYGATSAIVNNTAGTAQNGFKLQAIPGEFNAFTILGTDALAKAEFDSWIVSTNDAVASLAAYINVQSIKVGIAPIYVADASGTSTSPTIPAVGTSATGVGSAAVELLSANVTLGKVRNNVRTIAVAAGRLADAIGLRKLDYSAVGGQVYTATASAYLRNQLYISPVNYTDASVSGTAGSTASATEGTAAFAAVANDLSTIADYLDIIGGSPYTASMTGSTGTNGTAITALPALTGFTHVQGATDMLSLTDSNATMVIIKNNMADYLGTINILSGRVGLPYLTDTGLTAYNAAVSTHSAITGVSTTGALLSDVNTAVPIIKNNMATLINRVNVLLGIYGQSLMTDNSGGVASPMGIAAMPATFTTSTSGATAVAVQASAYNTWYGIVAGDLDNIQDKIIILLALVNDGILPKYVAQ